MLFFYKDHEFIVCFSIFAHIFVNFQDITLPIYIFVPRDDHPPLYQFIQWTMVTTECKTLLGGHNSHIDVTFHNILYHKRKCRFCDSNVIGSEFHYLFNYTPFNDHRQQYIKIYCRANPSIAKLNILFNKQVLSHPTS